LGSIFIIESLVLVLIICVYSLFFVAIKARDHDTEDATIGGARSKALRLGLICYLASYPTRIYVLVVQGVHNNVASQTSLADLGKLSAAPSIIVAWLLIDGRLGWRRGERHVLLIVAVGEAFWGLIYHSKAPVLAVLVGLYCARRGTNMSRKTIILWCVVIAATFEVIGAIRVSPAAEVSLEAASAYKPGGSGTLEHAVATPVYELLARTDLLNSIAQVKAVGAGSYMAPSTALSTAANFALPMSLTGRPRVVSGVLWQERYFHLDTNTSIAAGLAGEGYGIAGDVGAAVEALFAGLILVLAVNGAMHSRHRLVQLIGCSILTGPAIWEQGSLGIAASVIDSIEVGIVVSIMLVVIGSLIHVPDKGAPSVLLRADAVGWSQGMPIA
jgi:hypothetical protein